MNNQRQFLPKPFYRGSKGQALILIAVSFMVILAFIGLAVDLGRVFIFQGMLRKSVDAASLAAASQFREGRSIAEMTIMAEQIMSLNGVDPDGVIVEDCPHALVSGDPDLCVTPRRKFVRVTATATIDLTFMAVTGLQQVELSAQSTAEAASIDVVLVIDISESMTSDAGHLYDNIDNDGDGTADDGRFHMEGSTLVYDITPVGDPDNFLRDPAHCNPLRQCQPFEKVRSAANSFVDRILDLSGDDETDRLAIVIFANGWEGGTYATQVIPPGWITDKATAQSIITNLTVYQPPDCDPGAPLAGLCIKHYPPGESTGTFVSINCPVFDEGVDPSSCTTTNIGGGMRLAGNIFGDPNFSRPEALWVTILLTDGAANASTAEPGVHPYGYCPESDWDPPFCRDEFSYTRHITETEPLLYDADDYARDNIDFVGCFSPTPAAACDRPGQGAVIFTIGLGNQVVAYDSSSGDIAHGVALLRYAAATGDDGDPATDLCADLYDTPDEWEEWCGNYYFDATGDDLIRVFEDIASRIFTRIAR